MQEMQKTQFHPWFGKVLWRRKWLPAPALLPGKSQGQSRLVGWNPWGLNDSDTTWLVNMHAFLHIYYLIAFPSSESKAKVQLCPLNLSLLIIRRIQCEASLFQLPTCCWFYFCMCGWSSAFLFANMCPTHYLTFWQHLGFYPFHFNKTFATQSCKWLKPCLWPQSNILSFRDHKHNTFHHKPSDMKVFSTRGCLSNGKSSVGKKKQWEDPERATDVASKFWAAEDTLVVSSSQASGLGGVIEWKRKG